MSRKAPPWVRPVADYGPLIAFLVVYYRVGLIPATIALMVATPLALGLAYWERRRIPAMPLVTAAVVGVFGGLTIAFDDETFIKMKPTIVQGGVSAVLLVGLATGRAWLRPVLGAAWSMDEAGWRKLTFRFALFFAAMAGLNELVWRTQPTDTWVNFKVFGIMGLTLLFVLTQTSLLRKHGEPVSEGAGAGGASASKASPDGAETPASEANGTGDAAPAPPPPGDLDNPDSARDDARDL